MCLRKDLIAFSDISLNESSITDKYRPLLLGIVRYFLLSTPTPTGAIEMLVSVRPELLIFIFILSSSEFRKLKQTEEQLQLAFAVFIQMSDGFELLDALLVERTRGRARVCRGRR